MMAKVSSLYSNEGIDLGSFVQPFPADGSVPSLPDWQWVHTPGHTPGHVCFFREDDRALITGDAFTTVDQESAAKVMVQRKEIHGPPKYLTPDWQSAWESICKLQALQPSLAMVSHGLPIYGNELSAYLLALSENFDQLALPQDHAA